MTDFHRRMPDWRRAAEQGFEPPVLKKGDLTYEWVNNVNADCLTQQGNDLVYELKGGNRVIYHDAVKGRPAGREDTPRRDPQYPMRRTSDEIAAENIVGVYLPILRRITPS